MTFITDIEDFHRAFCPNQVDLLPSFPSTEIEQLRIKLIHEETKETLDALIFDNRLGTESLAEIADGICDSIVVLIGTALAYGIPLQACWDEVHRSNMAKRNADGTVTYREDGKVLKPKGWTPPDLVSIIQAARKS